MYYDLFKVNVLKIMVNLLFGFFFVVYKMNRIKNFFLIFLEVMKMKCEKVGRKRMFIMFRSYLF